MDELRIGSGFTTGLLSKVISSVVKKKCGYDVTLKINGITATIDGDKLVVDLAVHGELPKDEIPKILKSIDL